MLHVWDCLGQPQQQWVVGGYRVKLAGTELCATLPNGDAAKQLQLQACGPSDRNQVFSLACV